MNNHENINRLTTTDAKGRRIYLYPSDVRGKFKRLRTKAHLLCILIFLVLPWLRIAGNPVFLLDLGQRKLHILGATFWAHETPILAMLIAGAAIGLGIVTALWGRVWCGWTCPQTVFIDGLFRRIERLIEGDGFARKKLDQNPGTPLWIFKKAMKWLAFALASLVIAHSFLAYFLGTEKIKQIVFLNPSLNPESFSIMVATTLLLLFNFGWFREQFCTVLCPYGRFQSILMDENSLIVAYDIKRGEPRRDPRKKLAPTGDCVNCSRCVQVCPTGIDIRNGLQLECIACTSCIDACDEVMTRIGRPKGLIRYRTSVDKNVNVLRPRILIYLCILLLIAGGFAWQISGRNNVQVQFIRSKEAPYQIISNGPLGVRLVNHFKLTINNSGAKSKNPKYLGKQ